VRAETVNVDEKIERLARFRDVLLQHHRTGDPRSRSWLNQDAEWVRSEVIKAKCSRTVTISPPPIIGGLVYSNIDPFDYMFEAPYGKSLVPSLCDMIDKTIGFLGDPVESDPTPDPTPDPTRTDFLSNKSVEIGYAFIAMAIDKDDHQLVDVLEAIKDSAAKCGIKAERVDEVETNERITDRILESIIKAEFVIVDLTKERPNVFWEAGFAHGLGKIPIYLARQGTTFHFDLKDYPIIEFRNMKELKEKLTKRLIALSRQNHS
jgi:hypothetical protein